MNVKSVSFWAEAGLWLIGICCLAVFSISKLGASHAQSMAMSSLEAKWAVSDMDDPDQELWSPERVEAFELAEEAGGLPKALAVLSIDSVNVKVAVFNDTTDHVLDIGAGRVLGTAHVGEPGNLAIAAHRDGFFRGLKDITMGDEIALETAAGRTHYSVTGITIVDPDDISVLAPTDEASLTLITCYPFYYVGSAPQRFIVHASIVAQDTGTLVNQGNP